MIANKDHLPGLRLHLMPVVMVMMMMVVMMVVMIVMVVMVMMTMVSGHFDSYSVAHAVHHNFVTAVIMHHSFEPHHRLNRYKFLHGRAQSRNLDALPARKRKRHPARIVLMDMRMRPQAVLMGFHTGVAVTVHMTMGLNCRQLMGISSGHSLVEAQTKSHSGI